MLGICDRIFTRSSSDREDVRCLRMSSCPINYARLGPESSGRFLIRLSLPPSPGCTYWRELPNPSLEPNSYLIRVFDHLVRPKRRRRERGRFANHNTTCYYHSNPLVL
ncbi:Hypothetical protein NTJ_07072 [Nesidiocoris tenuis]|uniref:Uncharacterized protein n=1 Tax=Nesidiocoris tenuis TaxID=355587 RepID=A0ABN7AQC0_9HEMI|nr:Hypothetical protein NTJ_07072 [Nesidiocoris tenuis]